MSIDEHNTKPAGTAVGATAAMGDVCPSKRKQLDLATVKDQLEETTGPEYWRSLESWRAAKNFRRCCTASSPRGLRSGSTTSRAADSSRPWAHRWRSPVDRMHAHADHRDRALCAAAGKCRSRPSKYYATAFTLGGYASPILVESHLFRPTKIEGNPQHPASLGGTDIYAQASLLDLYDPDRAQNITTWAMCGRGMHLWMLSMGR